MILKFFPLSKLGVLILWPLSSIRHLNSVYKHKHKISSISLEITFKLIVGRAWWLAGCGPGRLKTKEDRGSGLIETMAPEQQVRAPGKVGRAGRGRWAPADSWGGRLKVGEKIRLLEERVGREKHKSPTEPNIGDPTEAKDRARGGKRRTNLLVCGLPLLASKAERQSFRSCGLPCIAMVLQCICDESLALWLKFPYLSDCDIIIVAIM